MPCSQLSLVKLANDMGSEIDLMRFYPRPKSLMDERPIAPEADRKLSRTFGIDYFDGDRCLGYGGFSYHPWFWTDTVVLIADHYGLTASSSILDVGCARASC